MDAATASHIEWRIGSPLAAAAVDAALRTPNRLAHQRPGEGEPAQPGGPVNWYAMSDDEYEDTWGAFVDFLTWALAHWSFTTEHIPARCWWLHPDIVEELTGWWGLWQVCVRDPTASAGDQMSFQERTFALKQRLEHSYRGRCRHDHVPTPALTLTAPPTHTEPG